MKARLDATDKNTCAATVHAGQGGSAGEPDGTPRKSHRGEAVHGSDEVQPEAPPTRAVAWYRARELTPPQLFAEELCKKVGRKIGGNPWPRNPVEAAAMRLHGGRHWDNDEVRGLYLETVSQIPLLDALWKTQGWRPLVRAQHAYEIRHHVRMTCREMMDPDERELLRQRDQKVAGSPDGPTFESLVAEARDKEGLTGDAVYPWIVDCSGITDAATNDDPDRFAKALQKHEVVDS